MRCILRDKNDQWLEFRDPVHTISTCEHSKVLSALSEIETLVHSENLHAVGFLSYEAAPAFDSALQVRKQVQECEHLPLLHFGLFSNFHQLTPPEQTRASEYTFSPWKSSVNEEQYLDGVTSVKREIQRGNTYQVNYTYRLQSKICGDAESFFWDLQTAQQGAHAAFIETPEWALCCASPELFFELNQQRLTSRPMKGTCARGRTGAEDEVLKEELSHCEKTRAENVMIVDMVRNDMSRICDQNTVGTKDLFHIERYPTLFQMVSTVTCQTKASVLEILTALFPCASITGAPKARTMAIIAENESSPRKAYTGAIGIISPDRQARFGVAIRTAIIDKRTGDTEYGVGGGIVAESSPSAEYGETELKAEILLRRDPPFELLESCLWEQHHGFFLLEDHLTRMKESAEYFGFKDCTFERLKEDLFILERSFQGGALFVRVLLSPSGIHRFESRPINQEQLSAPISVCLSESPVSSKNRFLFHKTTNRVVYEAALAQDPLSDDVLLWNERGELTESCRANIVVERDGLLLTPPIESGLLNGVFREHLLRKAEIQESVIHLSELKDCSAIYLINSVRRWQKVIQQPSALFCRSDERFRTGSQYPTKERSLLDVPKQSETVVMK